MDIPFTQFTPVRFPIEFFHLVAPFWADINIAVGVGNISYQTFTTGSPLLDIVNNFISDEEDFDFSGRWMLLTEWNDVPPFGGPINQVIGQEGASPPMYSSHVFYVSYYDCIYHNCSALTSIAHAHKTVYSLSGRNFEAMKTLGYR